jgi:hypothetical protein
MPFVIGMGGRAAAVVVVPIGGRTMLRFVVFAVCILCCPVLGVCVVYSCL